MTQRCLSTQNQWLAGVRNSHGAISRNYRRGHPTFTQIGNNRKNTSCNSYTQSVCSAVAESCARSGPSLGDTDTARSVRTRRTNAWEYLNRQLRPRIPRKPILELGPSQRSLLVNLVMVGLRAEAVLSNWFCTSPCLEDEPSNTGMLPK